MTEPGSSQGSTPDYDAADTDPFAVPDPYGTGWSAGWGANWSGDGELNSADADMAPGRFDGVHDPVPADWNSPSSPVPFAFPASPGPSRRVSGRTVLIAGGAIAGLAVVVGLTVWLINRPPSSPEPGTTATAPTAAPTTSATAPAPTRDVRAETRLLRMLPAGYPTKACRPVDPEPGAIATVNCADNSDPGGPTSASYTLAHDKAALDSAFTAAVHPESIVVCPGNIQSPGPWRRNAAPERVAGTLVCGMPGNVPTVGWTDEERLFLSVVRSDPPGPSLDQLYQWWSAHS